jgi:hypothetical protein
MVLELCSESAASKFGDTHMLGASRSRGRLSVYLGDFKHFKYSAILCPNHID